MILLLVAHGAPGQIQAGEKDHFACWASGPLSKGDHKWGEKKDEFVIDQRDLGDGARFNMKLRPELLEDPHNREKSGLFTAERLEGLSVAEQIEFTESLEVYTLFDSVPELVDYVFALDVFDAALCPRELDPLERDYFRLNPLENHLRVDLRPFPPRGCLFGAAGVMRVSAGDAGGFLRHSSGRSGVSPSPWVWGCGRRDHCLSWDRETGGGRGCPGWSCCPEPGSESRRSPGAAAWWGEISWLPDHPGGPQGFSLELSALKSRRPDPSSLVALVLRAGFLKKKFLFLPKRLLGYWDHLFFGFCSNNAYLKSDHF